MFLMLVYSERMKYYSLLRKKNIYPSKVKKININPLEIS